MDYIIAHFFDNLFLIGIAAVIAVAVLLLILFFLAWKPKRKEQEAPKKALFDETDLPKVPAAQAPKPAPSSGGSTSRTSIAASMSIPPPTGGFDASKYPSLYTASGHTPVATGGGTSGETSDQPDTQPEPEVVKEVVHKGGGDDPSQTLPVELPKEVQQPESEPGGDGDGVAEEDDFTIRLAEDFRSDDDGDGQPTDEPDDET